jgi:hypothetical protein
MRAREGKERETGSPKRRAANETEHRSRPTSRLATRWRIAYASCVRTAVLFLRLAALLALVACAQPEPKTPQKTSGDGVPANSLSDARLHGEEDPKDKQARNTGGESKEDPTKPMTTKMGEAPPPEPGSSTSSKGGAKPGAGSGPPAAGKGAVSKSECDRVMDKYLDLEIGQNPQLKDVPPEVIEQAKQMAREKHGEAPCTATRAQYTCAMAASTTAAWQRCMK